MAVTAKRDNMRLIAIVLGEDSGKIRNNETMQLLDYGFNIYKSDLIKTRDDIVGKVKIDKSNKKYINVYPKDDITILNKKSDVSLNYNVELKLNDINLPVKKNTVVGKIYVKNANKVISSMDAIVIEDVNKISYFGLLLNTLKDLLVGNTF